MNQIELIENKELREKLIDRIEVLERVKNLLTFAGTEYMSVELAAEYFEVDKDTLQQCIKYNKDELKLDGLKVAKRNNIADFLNVDNIHSKEFQIITGKGKDVVTFNDGTSFNITNTGMILIPKRAMLRIGMLLRDSNVAKEIRTRLLDITQDAMDGKSNIISGVINEITEEQVLSAKLGDAICKGDTLATVTLMAQLTELKNRRIKELEEEMKWFQAHSLTIKDSKKVINRLVKVLASKTHKEYDKVWNELYSKANYKLEINIKARKKAKGESWLDTLNEYELFELEVMAKLWAKENEIDVKKELTLGKLV